MIQTQLTWDLTKFFFSSPADPRIEEELMAYESAAQAFADKYTQDKGHLKDPASLLAAIIDYEQFCTDSRVQLYLGYITALNTADAEAEAALNLANDRITKADNLLLFFMLNLGKIDAETQKMLLNSECLQKYKYFLEQTFQTAKYDLSEAEEKIIALMEPTSYSMWVQGQEKLLSKQTIPWKGKKIPLSEALDLVGNIELKDNRKLHKLVMKKLRSVSDFAEAEINAVFTVRKTEDELRGFANPYDSTLLGHETSEEMVMALTKAVTNNNNIAQRFFALKAKLLNQEQLTYADRGASIGKTTKTLPFAEGCEIVNKAFENLDTKFSKMFQDFLANGQVDVYPKKGKLSGAFCSSGVGSQTFVMLNHIDNMDSVTTIAHEMGHAIHSEFSKQQTPIYQDYSTVVAEVASTFFEQVVFYNTLKTLSKEDQVVALHDKINQDISTIFRQVAFFNFELELHKEIRNKGAVTKEDIAKLINKHTKAYLGEKVKMTVDDGYFFVTLSHMRNYFYVYSYAYGCLVSKTLYRKYSEDPTYLEKIKQFLSAGSSASPQDIFASIGIDTTNPEFWEIGLKNIQDDIDKLEELTKASS